MGTVYQQIPSEMQRLESMGFTRVTPVAMTSHPPPPPPVRPVMSSPALKSTCRNLFGGSPRVGEIDEMLSAQQQKKIEYVKLRYNIDLGQNCNSNHEQISAALTKCEGAKKHSGAAALPYARPPGIKRTYQVRKANTAISNVPKRIRDDNLSSAMGTKVEETTEKEATVETEKETKLETKVEAKLETEKETKVEAKLETKVEAKLEAKAETEEKVKKENKQVQQQQQEEQQQNGEEDEDKQRQ